MEKTNYRKENQRKIETIVIMIYTIYDIGTSMNIKNNGWQDWIIILINIGWFLSLLVYFCKFRTYRFRAFFTSVMMQMGMIFYAMQVKDLFPDMVTIVAIAVFLGLYGIPDIIYTTVGSITFLLCYHIVFLGTIHPGSAGEVTRMLQQVVSVYLAEYMVHYLVKQQLKANKKQLKTIEELKEAERSKDDFLANVSHEIRTPINTICGMSEIVLREELPEKVREDIFNIQTAGRNLLSVVSDILDFSELQSGKMELAEVTYNITSTINDVINMTMALKSEKNIELVVDCNAGIPCGLLGDEQKIRRVIMNLVNNALKFTNEGCVSIIISSRKTDYGINLSVKVKDTGIGMEEESLEKLFTSFSQVDTKRNRQEGGIGLGLAISQAIIDAMGGFITVKSEFGKGSEIKFVIPQQVVDETPIVSVRDPERINAVVYIDMEQFDRIEIRDEYTFITRHMIEQLGVNCCVCYKLVELKRRMEHVIFTHVIISLVEYKQDEAYFDELARQTKVIIILERMDDDKVKNPKLLRIYKPFFVLPIVMMLNEEQFAQGIDENRYSHCGFVAPEVHVLAVDDNVMNTRVLEGLLRPYQIKVSNATSGREALEKIETMDYDFVFMDHMMPEMDGIETLHRIRKKQGNYFKKVPIIALTANAVAGMREMFLAEGFQDFVAKPVELSVLERVLKRNIPEKKIIRLNRHGEDQPKEKEIKENSTEEKTTEFAVGDLDVNKGITYCGGMENYIEVLKMHCQDGAANEEKIEQFYQQKDWKNYTILVHALKSSMLSIGAAVLSQMAKELEQAGKEENAEFIESHHGAMMKEYERVLMEISSSRMVKQSSEIQQAAETLETLDDAEFDKLAEQLEEAVYRLEGAAMLSIVEKLQQYSYHGHPLKELLEPVKKKIHMSDYMSASEVVQRLKEKLKNQ